MVTKFSLSIGLITVAVLVLGSEAANDVVITVNGDAPATATGLDGLFEVTMDVGTLTDGTHCNFTDPTFVEIVRGLNVSLLRVGGTEGDFTYYGEENTTTTPAPFTRLLTQPVWDDFAAFATSVGFQVLFGLNAGPFVRSGAEHTWNATMAARFVRRNQRLYPGLIAGYEFGNEPDLYFGVFPKSGVTANGTLWAHDMATVRDMITQEASAGTLAICCDVTYLPVLGALGWFYDAFVAAGGLAHTNVVTWHYYTLFGPKANNIVPAWLDPWSANPQRLAQPATLDEVKPWAAQVRQQINTSATPLWLGETGSVCFGGQLNVSNVWVDALAMVDKGGAITQIGHGRMFRQELCATHWTNANAPTPSGPVLSPPYALIDKHNIPRPSYYVMRFLRQLIGDAALLTTTTDSTVARAYAYSARVGVRVAASGRQAKHVITVINPTMQPSGNVSFCFSNQVANASRVLADAYVLSGCGGGLTSSLACVNDDVFAVDANGRLATHATPYVLQLVKMASNSCSANAWGFTVVANGSLTIDMQTILVVVL